MNLKYETMINDLAERIYAVGGDMPDTLYCSRKTHNEILGHLNGVVKKYTFQFGTIEIHLDERIPDGEIRLYKEVL